MVAYVSKLYYYYLSLSTFSLRLSTNLTEVVLYCGKSYLCFVILLISINYNTFIVVENLQIRYHCK